MTCPQMRQLQSYEHMEMHMYFVSSQTYSARLYLLLYSMCMLALGRHVLGTSTNMSAHARTYLYNICLINKFTCKTHCY